MTNTPSPTDEDRELIERLREADRNSVQRTLGSGIFGEAADRLESLLSDRAKLGEALGPFAKIAELREGYHDPEGAMVVITVEQCRHARAALDRTTDRAT